MPAPGAPAFFEAEAASCEDELQGEYLWGRTGENTAPSRSTSRMD
jgi:hypothetical protein